MSASIPVPRPNVWRPSRMSSPSAVGPSNGIMAPAPASLPAAHFLNSSAFPSHLNKELHESHLFAPAVVHSPRGRASGDQRSSRDSFDDLGFEFERKLCQPFSSEHTNVDPMERDRCHDGQLATSWPPPPRLTIVSRSATRWLNEYKGGSSDQASNAENGESAAPGVSFSPASSAAAASLLFPDYSKVTSAVDSVQRALVSGRAGMEKPPRDSVSGTYFFKRLESEASLSSKVTAVFKPADEEPGGSASPSESLISGCPSPIQSRANSLPRASPDWHDSSHSYRMSAAGFRHGEGAFKEVAVYILDHKNFAKVPQTALAEYKLVDTETRKLRTRKGAFQVYVPNVGDADDWGPGIFPTEDVHRIAALDIRILNFDRHGGNILVTRSDGGSYGLVPIDHAFTLPENIKPVPWAVWMDWPAAKQPLSVATKSYIASLDPDREACVLKDELGENIRPSSLLALKVATRLLQKGVVAGLSLYDIGLLIYSREGDRDIDEKSELEKIMDEANESAKHRLIHMGDLIGVESGSGPLELAVAVPACSSKSRQLEYQFDNYVVKYACRRIDELVRNISHRKQKSNGGLSAHCRARSIPDFCFQLGDSIPSSTEAYSLQTSQFVPGPPTSDVRSDVQYLFQPDDSMPNAKVRNCPELLEKVPFTVHGEISSPVTPSKLPGVPAPDPTLGFHIASSAVPVSIAHAGRPPKRGGEIPVRKSSPVSPHQFGWRNFPA